MTGSITVLHSLILALQTAVILAGDAATVAASWQDSGGWHPADKDRSCPLKSTSLFLYRFLTGPDGQRSSNVSGYISPVAVVHSGATGDSGFLKHDVAPLGEWLSAFRRREVLHPQASSGPL